MLEILHYYNQFLLSEKQTKKVFTIDTDSLTSEQVVEEVKQIITETSGYSFDKFDNSPSTQKNLSDFV